MQHIEKITDVIAADEWRHDTPSGQSVVSRIQIGRPELAADDPNGDWYCPVFIENFTDRIVPAYGVGQVDALMNAMMLVRSFADQIREFTPRALEHTDEPTA